MFRAPVTAALAHPFGIHAFALHARRWLMRIVLGIFGGIASYLLAALILGLIPINRDYAPADEGVSIFLTTNGVHADLVLPVHSEVIDWRGDYPTHLFPQVDAQQDFIAIGWGSRGFYLNTERWEDLTAQTAAMALSGAGSSAMHVEYRAHPTPGANVVALRISTQKYRELVAYIRGYAVRDASAQPVVIAGHHYGRRDAFFEAHGTYSALTTCNEWTRRALTHAGVRVPAWSPLDTALFYHLR